MSLDHWTAIDQYITDRLVPAEAMFEAVLRRSAEAGLPPIHVAPNQGKLLQLLVRIHGARRVLEVGTLGAYSTLWLARGLPAGGCIITLESEPKHAAVARTTLARAGLEAVVELREGLANDSLAKLAAEGQAPFDFVFIDADKVNIREYFKWALVLIRPGGLIVVDNVVRKGAITEPDCPDENVQGVRRFYDYLSGETRVTATAVQTVGSKGHDGFVLAVVNAG